MQIYSDKGDISKIYWRVAGKSNNTSTVSATISDIMICEGPDADYQPYNGETVREEQIKDVERTTNKLVNIYDTYGKDWDNTTYPSTSVLMGMAKGLDNFVNRQFSTREDFLDWVQNSAPVGSYCKYVQIAGSFRTIIIQKTSSLYGALFEFAYGSDALFIRRLYNGDWKAEKTVSLS